MTAEQDGQTMLRVSASATVTGAPQDGHEKPRACNSRTDSSPAGPRMASASSATAVPIVNAGAAGSA
ncbi:MAG: hypothetical protein QM674_19020 [Burkholderiaceae bacterium]